MSGSRALRAVAVIVALAVLAAVGWWVFPSDARRIRARLHALAGLASVPATEQDLARLARARKFGTMIAANIAVTVEGWEPVTGRETVVLLVARPSGTSGAVTVELTDVAVQVAASGTEANSTARARMTFIDPHTGQLSAEDRPLRLEWRKIDGEWLVSVAEIGAPDSGVTNAAA